jgi:GNAT superfamily N-acetyltransferase
MAKAVEPTPLPADVFVSRDVPDDWTALYGSEQTPQKGVEFPRVLNLLPSRHGFIVCRRKGRADAVALVSRAGSDVAVDCVLTRPDARRSGAARAVMHGAEAWAAAEGATRLLLSVVDENAAAMPLYLQLGYRKFASYHYRYKAD